MGRAVSRGDEGRRWLTSWPVALLLCGHLLLYLLASGHTRLVSLGEHLWDDYYLLRADIPIPTCNQGDLREQLQEYRQNLAPDDLFGGLLPETSDPDSLRKSLEQQRALCLEKLSRAEDARARVTGAVALFRAFDHGMAALAEIGRNLKRPLLAVLLFICAAAATREGRHISLRFAAHPADERVAACGELVANLCLGLSAYHYLAGGLDATVGDDHVLIRWLYLGGFSALLMLSFQRILSRTPGSSEQSSALKALACIPLYSYMAVAATLTHAMIRGDLQGPMLFVDRMMDFSDIFINVALYIWAGMMLRQSRLGELVFAVLKPWRFPPEILAFLLILLMAFPTAYTGASGVIVIALGAIIYREMRTSGARRQLAIAATAISGSSGILLQPCLLVVMIAALNREVTTQQMFASGGKILMLTACLFFLFAAVMRDKSFSAPMGKGALGPCCAALLHLLPHIVLVFLVLFFFRLLLGAWIDEFSAPVVLPFMALSVLLYERARSRLAGKLPLLCHAERPGAVGIRTISGSPGRQTVADHIGTGWSLATADAVVHIGALLTLMALSMAVGGALEHSGLIQGFIDQNRLQFNPMLSMTVLLVVLVLIGMFMDPYGAVILVSGTLAPFAIQQGVEPLHFWLITLVAFEVGYLSPPVAVNQLLARQVIGEEELELARRCMDTRATFWSRHEGVLLPLAVLVLTLLIVAYLPSFLIS